jgi:hypothetical protein
MDAAFASTNIDNELVVKTRQITHFQIADFRRPQPTIQTKVDNHFVDYRSLRAAGFSELGLGIDIISEPFHLLLVEIFIGRQPASRPNSF